MNRQVIDKKQNEDCETSPAIMTETKRAGRRRFIRGAGVAVPVILSVASRSTLACTCLSPSASASINLLHSRPNRGDDGKCAGLSPGYWKTHDYGPAAKTKFSLIDGGGNTYSNKTMKEVVGLTGNENFAALARHLAAAWCNLRSGKVSSNVLDLKDLQAMWNGRNGAYSPTAGVYWGSSQIIDYILTTFYENN